MESQRKKILLVDDETDILEFLKYNLQKHGFIVETATNGKSAIEKSIGFIPHLIILDIMMPEMDGIMTCTEIRKIPELNNTIIAMLSARGEDYSQIAGFEAGADDYIRKPIRPAVLVYKINALLNRIRKPDDKQNLVYFNNFIIDKEKFMVFRDGDKIYLPKKEFELLLLLVTNPRKVFTREEIFTRIWGDNVIVGERTIDVHIRRIREKIGMNSIKTYKGIGYSFT